MSEEQSLFDLSKLKAKPENQVDETKVNEPQVDETKVKEPDFTAGLELSKYEQRQIAYDKRRLNYWSKRANTDRETEGKVLLNLTIKELFARMSNALIELLEDVTELEGSSLFRMGSWVEILVKKDRMIYVGMMLVMISLLIYLVNV